MFLFLFFNFKVICCLFQVLIIMGNFQNSCSENIKIGRTQSVSRARKQFSHILTSLNQLSPSSFTISYNGTSFLSQNSRQSSYSVTRPWSRVSRRRWQESTLNNCLALSKTAWPVSQVEAAFLPEFRICSEVSSNSFEVLSEISKGAFGVVYKVKERSSGEYFAMKILQKYQIIHDKAIQQVKNEVKIQSMCGHHPFVVNCPFYWQTKQELFIISDYIEGGELSDLLNKFAPLSDELAKIYIAELALTIDFLHNAGVIYRDLKPENILLDRDGHIQVIDFGLSKWLPYNSKTGTICGTFQYMAPEIFSPELYSHAVDWWSLGVVACRLLTNQFPKRRPDQKVELPEDPVLSSAAEDLLRRLLEVNPKFRLKSVLALEKIAFYQHFNFAHIRAKKPIQAYKDLFR